MKNKIEIKEVTLSDLEDLSSLFDAYRVFYQKESHLKGAKDFLADRIKNRDSTIFLAREEKNSMGFTQLYPSFSSVSMKRIWILNDLYVDPNHRGRGVAQKLLDHSLEFCRKNGGQALSLRTAKDNHPAKRLYEHCGWKKDQIFDTYTIQA